MSRAWRKVTGLNVSFKFSNFLNFSRVTREVEVNWVLNRWYKQSRPPWGICTSPSSAYLTNLPGVWIWTWHSKFRAVWIRQKVSCWPPPDQALVTCRVETLTDWWRLDQPKPDCGRPCQLSNKVRLGPKPPFAGSETVGALGGADWPRTLQ